MNNTNTNTNNNENQNLLIQTVYNNYISHVNNNNRLLSNTIDVIRHQNEIYNIIIRRYITTSNSIPNPPNVPILPIDPTPPIESNPPIDRNSPVTISSDAFLASIYYNILNSNSELENNRNFFVSSFNRNSEYFMNRNNSTNITLPTINDLLESTTYKYYGEIENPINDACPISQKDFSNNDIVLVINNIIITTKSLYNSINYIMTFI